MDLQEVLRLLDGLKHGEFAEPALMLESVVKNGATIHGPRAPLPSSELIATYQRRARRLRQQGIRMPGYESIITLLSGSLDKSWRLVGIELHDSGGAVFISEDGAALGCFAYGSPSWRYRASEMMKPGQPHGGGRRRGALRREDADGRSCRDREPWSEKVAEVPVGEGETAAWRKENEVNPWRSRKHVFS
jgi:hypothetical protein